MFRLPNIAQPCADCKHGKIEYYSDFTGLLRLDMSGTNHNFGFKNFDWLLNCKSLVSLNLHNVKSNIYNIIYTYICIFLSSF